MKEDWEEQLIRGEKSRKASFSEVKEGENFKKKKRVTGIQGSGEVK